MKMELIQPFINAADAVLSETLASPVSVSDISMEEEAYQRHATAAMVEITGDIEGRVIFDIEDDVAFKVAAVISGCEVERDPDLLRETAAELANLVIGNAVTSLNDQGFHHFRVHPPTLLASEQGSKSSEDTEAVVLCLSTQSGSVFMNVALRYHRRMTETATAAR